MAIRLLSSETISGTGTFAGTVLIDGVLNYTGLTVKGSGASRPFVQFTNATQGALGGIGGTEGNDLILTSGTSGAIALTLDSSQKATFAGKVIVGKDSSNALEVFSSGDTEIGFSYATKGNIYAKIIGDITQASPLGGELAFQTATGGTLTERVRITAVGDLNILNATAADSKSIGITNAAGTTGWTFGNGVLSNTHQFVIYDNTAGSARMLIDSSGNVGIGTNSPAEKLTVNGNIITQGGDTNTGYDRYLKLYGNSDPATNVDRWAGLAVYNNGGNNVNELAFFTGSGDSTRTEKMRIAANGNVGIGTTGVYTNNHILNLSGTGIAIKNDTNGSSNNWSQIKNTATSSGSNLTFLTATGTNVMADNGDLGIGTTSPDTLFNIESALANTAIITIGCTKNDSSWTVGDRIGGINFFGADGSGQGAGVKGSINYIVESSSGGSNGMTFNVAGASNNMERMRINSSGNVGINNSSPSSKLNVNGIDNGSPEYSVTLGSTTTASGAANNASSTPVNKTLLTGYSIPYSGQTNSRLTTCGFLEFASTAGWTGSQRTWAITSGYDIGGQDSGAGGNKMAIVLGNAQNVSPQIGTNGTMGDAGDGDGANSLVACYWDNALNMRLADSSRLYTGNGGSAALPMITPGTDKNTGIWYPTSDTWAISTAGEERMRISSLGTLTVTASSPNGSNAIFYNNSSTTPYGVACSLPNGSSDTTRYLFFGDCAGSSKFKVSTSGQIYAVSTSIASISDVRFKENIRDIDTGLEEILNLKPRLFDWKENKGKNEKDSVGFIAQEVEKVLPKLVQENWSDNGVDKDGKVIEGEKYKTVSQADMIPTLVNAIQELEARVKELENK